MRKDNLKKERYEGRIQNEVNTFLRNNLTDPRLKFVSITKVELNNDYSMAQVYWDLFDSSKRGDVKKAMTKIAGKVRKMLADRLTVRQVPQINFVYDSQYEDEQKIIELLKS